jgi:hypothetical protein
MGPELRGKKLFADDAQCFYNLSVDVTWHLPRATIWKPGFWDTSENYGVQSEDPLRCHETWLPEFKPCPIPRELHSVYEEGPFTSCNVCGESLADGRLYEIQKVYRGKQVVFELGICHNCGENVAREFSEESLEAMKGFLLCNFKLTLEARHCHFCGLPRSVTPNYTIVGACRESSLIFPTLVMCEKCSEGLQDRLSRKTRDTQGDFIRDHFPGVPADLDLSPSFGGVL